ncbi:OTU domain-containing protein 6B [Astrocystis sublimbata]|nr:OTU domain-containing protein 6B [Astrocystis sublimbata]
METMETIQARHRKEQRDLQSRITSKKKNATKKTRKGVNDECANLEKDLRHRQEQELAALEGGDGDGHEPQAEAEEGKEPNGAGAGQNGTRQDSEHTILEDVNGDGIVGRLKKVTFSSDIPAEPEPTTQIRTPTQGPGPGPGQVQDGKKRNRQKERMARRAAEREEEAEAAKREAEGMTDHRGLERASLERAFGAHGLVEHEIKPDGHCLFSAVADQLAQRKLPISPSAGEDGGQVPPYKVVRRVATNYMESHPDDFMPFLEEPLDSYVPKIRDTAEWGGQLELLALASAYQVEIKVVQNGRTETIQPSSGHGGGEAGDRTIWLAYYRHGYSLGEHYNSLRKKG